MRTLTLTAFLTVMILAMGCSGESKPQKPNTPLARNVAYLQSVDDALGGKSILERHVRIAAPEEEYAKLDHAAIAQTAMDAAWSASQETGADIVIIWIEADKSLIGQGRVLGKAVYVPGGVGADGKKCLVWTVQAANRYPTTDEIAATVAWEAAANRLRTGAGLDEDLVRQEVAQQLGIPADKARPYLLFMESYKVD